MDQLSIMKSITSVAAIAALTARAFKELRELCNTLPGGLHALSNEVSDIELVLHQVALIVEKRIGASTLEGQEVHIHHLLDQAGSKLEDLRIIVDILRALAKTSKTSIFRAQAWRKIQPKIQALQEDFRTVKCRLNAMLGASNSRDMIRIRADLDAISTTTSNSAQFQINMEQNLHTSLVRHQDTLTNCFTHIYQQVDQRIGDVEELLKVPSRSDASQSTQSNGYFVRASIILSKSIAANPKVYTAFVF